MGDFDYFNFYYSSKKLPLFFDIVKICLRAESPIKIDVHFITILYVCVDSSRIKIDAKFKSAVSQMF